ncbi:MAG: rhomboid family intramembrane serine protease [Alphaproteobacteria bacterium]
MIPLWDASRRPVHFPVMTAFIIVANVVGFMLELSGGDDFVLRWSVVPADIVAGHHWETLLTSMFLHGSWAHIIGNMVFLWAFGPEIEDVMNPLRYLAFYLLGGVLAMSVQVAANPTLTIPCLGASGAIAAVMGAFLVLYPRDRIRTLLFFGFFVTMAYVPAVLLIGFWFVIQLLGAGIGAVAQVNTGGIAYLAHVSGAVFGAIAVGWFRDRARVAAGAAD